MRSEAGVLQPRLELSPAALKSELQVLLALVSSWMILVGPNLTWPCAGDSMRPLPGATLGTAHLPVQGWVRAEVSWWRRLLMEGLACEECGRRGAKLVGWGERMAPPW